MFGQSTNYSDEAFLRDRIWEEPALIPVSEMGLPTEARMVPLKETSLPGAGSSDVILIDSLGNIVIAECKLATNPEKKRTVIGQVLDYASPLATLSYDDLDTRVVKEHEHQLHELMEERVPAEKWDEDQFRMAVSNTLSSGSFKLVIAIDKMDPDLARILHYVSSQGKLRIFGLELRYHKRDDVEVIIPYIANPIEVGPVTNGRVWNAKDFRAELDNLEDEKVRAAAVDILDFALDNPDGMKWGWAEAYGAFGFRANAAGTWISVFTYATTGVLSVNLNTLQAKSSPAAFEMFVDSIANLRGFEKLHVGLGGLPQFQTSNTLRDESTRAGFKKAVLALQASLR